MKKALLTGIAALFLGTEAAHAYPPRYYNCGKAFVKIQTFSVIAGDSRAFPTRWTVWENWEKEEREHLSPITSLNLRCTQKEGEWVDKCWLNGKFCPRMSDEEGKKVFPDDDAD